MNHKASTLVNRLLTSDLQQSKPTVEQIVSLLTELKSNVDLNAELNDDAAHSINQLASAWRFPNSSPVWQVDVDSFLCHLDSRGLRSLNWRITLPNTLEKARLRYWQEGSLAVGRVDQMVIFVKLNNPFELFPIILNS